MISEIVYYRKSQQHGHENVLRAEIGMWASSRSPFSPRTKAQNTHRHTQVHTGTHRDGGGYKQYVLLHILFSPETNIAVPRESIL